MNRIPRQLRSGLGLALGAFALPVVWMLAAVLPGSDSPDRSPSPDIYGYTAPMWLHIQRAWESGQGLLWNDFQNAGQPFLAIPSSTVLYPPTWMLGWLDIPNWLAAWSILHLAIAGIGAFLFARTLGLRPVAASATAIAVQLGGILPFFAMWSPLVVASYAWFPVALYACERTLTRPSFGGACSLAVVLTLQLTSGFPQISVFTYALIGLRAAWELATRRNWEWRKNLSLLALGLALPALLGAVYLLPVFEVLGESVRAAPMDADALNEGYRGQPLERLRDNMDRRWSSGGLLAFVMIFAGAALARPRSQRIVFFYALAGGMFLALVPDSPLRDLYQSLPGLDRLRGPERLAWITSLCACIIVGHGVDALAEARSPRSLLLTLGAALVGGLAFHALTHFGLLPRELALAGAALLIVVTGWQWPALRVAVAPLLLLALAVDVWFGASNQALKYLPDDRETRASAGAFEFIAARHSLQDRVFVKPARRWLGGGVGLLDKTPSLFLLPSVSDYEHAASLRYASFYVYMTKGTHLETADEWIMEFVEPPVRVPLFNMLAPKYIVTDRRGPPLGRWETTLLFSEKKLRVFENPNALPRAYFVPEARVVADSRATLEILADRSHEARRIVLLERRPDDGFVGKSATGASASVTIERAAGEELRIATTTAQAGFLVVSDQYFPGWNATVNGEPTEILRANYAFRAVHVPAGSSEVVFRYAPASLRWGATLSVMTMVVLLALGLRARFQTR